MEPVSSRNRLLLQQLLGMLRALHWAHWTAHWQSKGTSAYGDHLLFERLYKGLEEEIDGLAEKLVSYFGVEAVAAVPSMEFAEDFLDLYEGVPDLYRKALSQEMHLQRALKKVYDSGKESGEMPLGLDDFLMSLANTHETHIFLLRQRMRGEP